MKRRHAKLTHGFLFLIIFKIFQLFDVTKNFENAHMSKIFIHGEFGSGLPGWINLHPKTPILQLNAILSSLQHPIIVLGHSYGAFVAIQLTGVDRLILAAPIGLAARLGILGQFWAIFFKLFGALAHKHISWTSKGFEWMDVVTPPAHSHVLLGSKDWIVEYSELNNFKCKVSIVDCSHGLDGFMDTISGLLSEPIMINI